MKKHLRHVCALLGAGLMLFSCETNYIQRPDTQVPQTMAEATQADKLRHTFAHGLAKALHTSPEMRAFIKAEALKMFNDDYDVPYHLVKNEKLSSGKTLRETLAPHFDHPETLATIELSLPLLTLFVPALPEGSFSAETWNTAEEVPHVAVRLTSSNSVPLVDYEGNEMLLAPELIPSFPVVVVKDNERLVSEKQKGFNENTTQRILTGSNGVRYKFVDELFDRELQDKKKAAGRGVLKPFIDSKLKDAYNIYKNTSGWHRDYIYYNITPQSPNGEFSYDYIETIRSFKFTGDAWAIYQKIADQTGDPSPTVGISHDGPGSIAGWTDGFFEIRASALIQARNGIGGTIRPNYLIQPQNLFEIQYGSSYRYSTLIPRRTYRFYYPIGATAKSVSANMALISWDLASYAFTMRIDVEEVDLTTEVSERVSLTSSFASNFGLEGTFKKLGLKFGASAQVTQAGEVNRKYTLESDELGPVIVNFADNVIVSESSLSYFTREYDNGLYSISLEPRRVQ
jgi:hypothetical protein